MGTFNLMTLNKNILSSLGSPDYEVNQTVSISYAKLCIVSISIPVVIAPALLAIIYSQEQEAMNIFLIILLLTDIYGYCSRAMVYQWSVYNPLPR